MLLLKRANVMICAEEIVGFQLLITFTPLQTFQTECSTGDWWVTAAAAQCMGIGHQRTPSLELRTLPVEFMDIVG